MSGQDTGPTIGDLLGLCEGAGLAVDVDDDGHLRYGDLAAHQARWLQANSVPLQTALQQRAALAGAYGRVAALDQDAGEERAALHDDIEQRRRLCANVLALPADHPDAAPVPADQ